MRGGGRNILELRISGPFLCRFENGDIINVGGEKHKILLAMLALAPGHRHSRNWLRETLWSRVDKEQGADSLRQCLSSLRRRFGEKFEHIFHIDRYEVGLKQGLFRLVLDPSQGRLLEGVELTDTPMRAWYNRALETLETRTLSGEADRFGNLRPRISIVPFLAKHNNDADKHLSDLIAQEVLRILSRNRSFDVISHLSSRQFAGPSLDLQALRNALDANYLATGTVSSENGRFRLDVDFIEVASGRLVWSNPVEERLSSLLQDNSTVMAEIAHRIGSGVLKTSVELARSQPLPEVESHALFMAALSHMHQHRLQTFSTSRHLLEQLAARHSDRAPLRAWLGMWYLLRLSQGLGSADGDDVKKALNETQHALAIDPECPISLTIDGMARSHDASGFDTAYERFEDAENIDPNNAMAHLMHSRLCSFSGNGEKAIELAERAVSLSPRDPQEYFYEGLRATAYIAADRYAEARSIVERSIEANPRHTSSLRGLAITCQLMGDSAGARAALQKLRHLEPNLTVTAYLAAHPAGKLEIGQKWGKALADAGLPI
ncbi:MAG: hypothetical protein AAFR27_06375 [Pseudomonadota bacterium]